MSDIERKALIAEIERFKEEAMEIKIVQALADSYENDGLFDHSISDDNKVSWMRVQAWQLWGFWKANAVPKGFVLVPKEGITHFWQDNDEPENFCSEESDFDCLGDGVDIGGVLNVNKYRQANIGVEKLFGAWCSCEPKPFTKGTMEFRLFETHAEAKQAMAEAQEQAG